MVAALKIVSQELSDSDALEGIVGSTHAMRAVFDRVRRVARGSAPVVVVGETGTGKELIAGAIHRLGTGGPFAVLNCGAIPADLCESELFGHERGAFSGAIAQRRGIFEEADGGTLFLDEIGELPLALQPKLLRALETGVVRRVGGFSDRAVCVRIVVATHRDLAVEVRAGRFREDLFHRLAAVTVRLPPLRERVEDIPLLVKRFLEEERCEGRVATLGQGVIEYLVRQTWPGNVRELRNAIRRAVLLGDGILKRADFEQEDVARACPNDPHTVAIVGRSEDEILRELYGKTVAVCGGSARRAAQMLGLPRSTFSDRLRRYGVHLTQPQAADR